MKLTEKVIPASIVASLTHYIFINGCQTNFNIDGHHEIEIGDLYPDVALSAIDKCFDDYISNLTSNKTLMKASKNKVHIPAAMVERQ